MLTSLQALLRLAVLRRLGVFICALATLLATTSTASALDPLQTKTRVWGFDFAEHNSAGLLGVTSSGKHLGDPHARAEQASGSPHAARGAARAFGGLSRAAEFGLRPYGQLRQAIQGTGLQPDHLIEQRFAHLFGGAARSEGLSVAVTQAEHQAFTNAWRARIPYGPSGTGAATRESVLEAARDVYRNYPEILRGLGL